MSYIPMLRVVVNALKYLVQGMGEKGAFVKSIKESKVKRSDISRLAFKILMEVSKNKFRYDRLIERVGLSNIPFPIRSPVYLFLYFAENYNAGELCRFLRDMRVVLSIPIKVEHLFGILISYRGDIGALRDPCQEIEDLSISLSFPQWFVGYCFKLLGRADAIHFMRASLQSLPAYIWINTLKAEEGSILKILRREGVKVREVKLIPNVYRVERTNKPLISLNSWRKGYISIQDLLGCLVGNIADPKPYNKVLDLCAAPGGKTAILAQLMGNKGEIYSLDLSQERLNVWMNQMKRLGIEIAKPILSDVRDGIPLKGEMDVVLLDPPCTGTGILMKNPSMKDRLSPSVLKAYTRIQWSMLTAASKMVRKGGYLVYSTCSITREENEDLIWRFLRTNYDFELIDLKFDQLPRGLYLKECIRLFPQINLCNGGFIAKLRRT